MAETQSQLKEIQSLTKHLESFRVIGYTIVTLES